MVSVYYEKDYFNFVENKDRCSSLSRIECKDELLDFLKKEPEKCNVVVMPDFFYDRLIDLDCDATSFSSTIADIAKRKGGSIDGVKQTNIRGGNAINTASALSALGLSVTPIVCTNRLGLKRIEFFLEKYCVDLSHVKIVEKASMTTALELKTEIGKVNVMLRDLGGLSDFGPSDLTCYDYTLIENSDYICLFNWAGTRKYGSELAESVFCRVKTRGKGKTYYDTADPTPNRERVPELIGEVLKNKVDVLSLNENEAVFYASLLNDEASGQIGKRRLEDLAMEAARILAENLTARIDLHTTVFSATFSKNYEAVVPAFKVEALRATGAGDSWNAGNIMADANNLSDECRLTLANAVAAYYLSDPTGSHPTRLELIKFIERMLKPFQAE